MRRVSGYVSFKRSWNSIFTSILFNNLTFEQIKNTHGNLKYPPKPQNYTEGILLKFSLKLSGIHIFIKNKFSYKQFHKIEHLNITKLSSKYQNKR